VSDERLRAAVRHDVGDLGRGEVEVDRREVPARLQAREVDEVELRAVGHADRDGVAVREPERAQPVHDAVALGEQLAARPVALLRVDERERPRVALRVGPEAVVGHGGSPRI
jgi:hypothetical protein